VARSKKGILLSQRKYIIDLLSDAGMLGCRIIGSLMDVNTKLLADQRKLLENVRRYKRLVGKLNYLTVIRSDITFAVSVVSQFLSALRTTHLEAVMRFLRDLKKTLRRGFLYSDHGHIQVASFLNANLARCLFDRSVIGYCIFLERNLVS